MDRRKFFGLLAAAPFSRVAAGAVVVPAAFVPIQSGRIPVYRLPEPVQRRELELVMIDPDQDYTAVPGLI